MSRRRVDPRITMTFTVLSAGLLSGCQSSESDTRIRALEQEVARLRKQQDPPARPPATTPSWRSAQGGDALTIDGQALFYSGQAKLRDSGKALLAELASEINTRFPRRDIYVYGHTDNDPIRKTTWLDNRELSVARAVAVVRVLESHGIPPGRLIACGCGEHRPLVANSDREGKSRNRRVEIVARDPLLATRQ